MAAAAADNQSMLLRSRRFSISRSYATLFRAPLRLMVSQPNSHVISAVPGSLTPKKEGQLRLKSGPESRLESSSIKVNQG
jgi:hypothetical protein